MAKKAARAPTPRAVSPCYTGKVALLPLQAVLLQTTGQFRNIGYWYVSLHTKEGEPEK